MLALQERTDDFVTALKIAEEPPKPFLNEYLPSQEEILRACQEIQQEWTEAERRRRRGYRRANHQASLMRVVRMAFTS
jgi:hypothetical protein